jgi:hypothetical protein
LRIGVRDPELHEEALLVEAPVSEGGKAETFQSDAIAITDGPLFMIVSPPVV